MPTDPFLPENRKFPRDRSPDIGSSDARKRRRKVLSCYDCRRRKLQCDRAQPACSRCVKTGQVANCLYIEDSAELPDHGDKPPASAVKVTPFYSHSTRAGPTSQSAGETLARLEYQDGRIKQLEAALAQSSGTNGRLRTSTNPLTPESAVTAIEVSAPIQDRDLSLLRGKNFKTQFHGNTHPGALIAHVPELATFSRETFELFPALLKVRDDMHALETRTEYAGVKHGALSDADLSALLPSKSEADELVEVYKQNLGSIYQVLHLPSFEDEYDSLWSEPENARAHFVAIVLCVMASAQCLTTKQPWLYCANSSVAREKAVTAIHAVENWLIGQSQKHVSAADFQIRVLLMLAKLTSARKYKRTWTELGDLMRFCMAAGLHRNPDLLRKPTTLLDKELRKRVWACVSEMELQAAFDRGMISTPWILQSDCPPPMHISDEDIDGTSTHLPTQRRSNDFTSVSYLAAASESMMLRTTLNTNLNNIRHSISFDDARRYTDEIEAHLSGLPHWQGAGANISKAMLTLNLRQYLLVLHDRQIRQAETHSERDYSRMVVINTAKGIINTHRSLTSQGCYVLELLRSDQVRAALSICHLVAVADPHADDALSMAVDHAAAQVLPDTIEMVTDKILRFGREQRQLWVTIAASSCVKCRRDPSKRTAYMQEAVDKVTRPYYKIMACQDDSKMQPPSHQPSAQRKDDTPKIDSAPRHESKASDYYSQETQDFSLPTDFDFDELAAWTFDDFSFNPTDLAQAPYAPQQQFLVTPSATGDGGF